MSPVHNYIYCMAKIFNTPRVRSDAYGNPVVSAKAPQDFNHLVGYKVADITLFDDGTDELIEQGAIILPRHYFIFVGIKDGEIQFKPYEFNQYRVVVSTYKDIISSVESIG